MFSIIVFFFFLMFPACVAYRHWPHLQLVTSRPLITCLPTSALPSALDPTPYCCFCRTRSVSELFSMSLNISELMVKNCQGLNLCSQRFSGSFLDFITSVGKLAGWVKRAAVPCVWHSRLILVWQWACALLPLSHFLCNQSFRFDSD